VFAGGGTLWILAIPKRNHALVSPEIAPPGTPRIDRLMSGSTSE
jgi:hypothetical protein